MVAAPSESKARFSYPTGQLGLERVTSTETTEVVPSVARLGPMSALPAVASLEDESVVLKSLLK
jgi:hypothetical protein